jgi:PAS domain S-box-containing protein
MLFNFPPFSIFFIVGGILALLLVSIIWHRSSSPGAFPFTLFILSVALWIFGRIFEAGAVDFIVKTYWGRFMFFGAVSTGPLWLFFTLDYCGYRWWKKKKYLIPVIFIPIVSLILIWTNQYHGLIWPEIYFSPGTGGKILVWEHGIAFWIMGIYNHILFFLGIFVMLQHIIKNPSNSRRKVVLLIIGTFIPIIANVIYLAGLSPIKGLDLTPFAFVVAGIIYAVVLFGFRFLDIIPIAYNSLIRNMHQGLIILNKDGVIIDINPSAAQMLGISFEEAHNQSLTKIWPHLDFVRFQLGKGQHTEMSINRGGVIRYLDISTAYLKDSEDRIYGQMIVMVDITERREMERAVRESELRYSTLVEQSSDGIVIIQDGVYRFANKTLSDMTGYEVEELVGQALPFGIDKAEHESVIKFHNLRNNGELAPGVYETLLRRKDGSAVDVEISVGSILYEGVVAHIATVRDITERKITQKKLEALYQREYILRNDLQKEIEKRGKYTRALVHELKTPLTSILASGELIEGELQNGDSTLLALAKNIRRASLNLEQRIDELLELARGETGLLTVNLMPVDIYQLVREIISEFKPVVESANLSLEYDLKDNMIAIADSSRVRQVIGILLSNAVKFSHEGCIKITVRDYNDDKIIVQVKDSGEGIDNSELENLFDPFLRKVNEGKALGGLGIGLALAKMYIDLHNENIWVESEPGKGSIFSFTLSMFKE